MTKNDIISAAIKDAPIPAAAAVLLAGVSLQNWVLIFTLIWAIARAVQSLLEIYWKWKDRKALRKEPIHGRN